MLTPRQKALAASSPTIGLLLGSLLWNIWDRRKQLLARRNPPSQRPRGF